MAAASCRRESGSKRRVQMIADDLKATLDGLVDVLFPG